MKISEVFLCSLISKSTILACFTSFLGETERRKIENNNYVGEPKQLNYVRQYPCPTETGFNVDTCLVENELFLTLSRSQTVATMHVNENLKA